MEDGELEPPGAAAEQHVIRGVRGRAGAGGQGARRYQEFINPRPVQDHAPSSCDVAVARTASRHVAVPLTCNRRQLFQTRLGVHKVKSLVRIVLGF